MLFNVGREETLESLKALKKSSSPKKSNGLLAKLEEAKSAVEIMLGGHKDKYKIIYDSDCLKPLADKIIANGIMAIDTETSGLDPLTDEIAGVCIYTPDYPSIYIPLNHRGYITKKKIENQKSKEDIAEFLTLLIKNNVKFIYHNAKFDIRVMRHTLGIDCPVYWDTLICQRLLDENRLVRKLTYGLKDLYVDLIDPKEVSVKFDSLFKGICFLDVPIETAYVYAARDAEITFKLYEYQKDKLELEGRVKEVYFSIEIPIIPVTANMEDRGIKICQNQAKKLYEKYNTQLEDIEKEIHVELQWYEYEIKSLQKKGEKIEYPVNLNSPTQLAIILYDILKTPIIDKKKPRGTGKEILEKVDHNIAKLLIKQGSLSTLMDSFILKLPKIVNSTTGRVHGNFNQVGTDTGRFSSSDPNLQNIPSKAGDIRNMFVADDDNVLISSDFSSQEPRIATHMCGDKKMVQAFKEGKDLYSVIASVAFNKKYEQCLEFNPTTGEKQPEGKKMRSTIKAIFLGVLYSKQVPSIAKDLGIEKKKAQEIFDKVMELFPALPPLINNSLLDMRKNGYVETIWGRRRRLPDLRDMDQYEFKIGPKSSLFDPLDFTTLDGLNSAMIKKYNKQLKDCKYYNDKIELIKNLENKGIIIKDNTWHLAELERKVLNSRVQGSAADQSKKAMILVDADKKLKDLGFKLLLTIHDELLGECPKTNYKEVSKRFSELMVEAGKDLLVPSKCDVEVAESWNGKSYEEK